MFLSPTVLVVSASTPMAILLFPVVIASPAVLPILKFVSEKLSVATVLIPVAFNPVVFPIIVNPPPFILTPLLAVIIPTASTLVTSS